MTDQLDAILGNLTAEMSNVGKGDYKGICGLCLKSITDDNFSKHIDTLYHNTCFQCTKCGDSLKGKPFYNFEGKLWCERDFVAANTTLCKKCGQPITDEVVEHSAGSFHATCFTCVTCSKILLGVSFVPHQGELYCVEDYHALTAYECGKCHKKIITSAELQECLKVGDKRFHPHCFVCKVCEKPFADNRAFSYMDSFYCDTHYTLAKAGKTAHAAK